MNICDRVCVRVCMRVKEKGHETIMQCGPGQMEKHNVFICRFRVYFFFFYSCSLFALPSYIYIYIYIFVFAGLVDIVVFVSHSYHSDRIPSRRFRSHNFVVVVALYCLQFFANLFAILRPTTLLIVTRIDFCRLDFFFFLFFFSI